MYNIKYREVNFYGSLSLYIYIYIYGEIVDFGESDKIIKTIGKVDKSSTYNGISSNISFFIQERTSSDSLP